MSQPTLSSYLFSVAAWSFRNMLNQSVFPTENIYYIILCWHDTLEQYLRTLLSPFYNEKYLWEKLSVRINISLLDSKIVIIFQMQCMVLISQTESLGPIHDIVHFLWYLIMVGFIFNLLRMLDYIIKGDSNNSKLLQLRSRIKKPDLSLEQIPWVHKGVMKSNSLA